MKQKHTQGHYKLHTRLKYMRSIVPIIVILVITLPLISSESVLTKPSYEPDRNSTIAYITSSGINVTGDTELASVAHYGSGTQLDPYVIDGLKITSDGDAIILSNTRAWIVIQNCILSSITPWTHQGSLDTAPHGVLLQNVTNCIIQDCIVSYKEVGVRIWESSNCFIQGNMVYNNSRWGIYLGYSNVTDVYDNVIHHNFWDGMYLLRSLYCSIYENTLYENGPEYGSGIQAYSTNQSEYRENVIYGQQKGIEFYVSTASNITRNVVYNNSIGLALYHLNDSLIVGNTVYGSVKWGILAGTESHRNSLYSNILYQNDLMNAHDMSGTNSNTWDNSLDCGNYYDDYDGEGTYHIGAVVDRYPMGYRPRCSSPRDIAFRAGETGHNITWSTSAFSPHRLEIRDNDTVIYTSTWVGGEVYLQVDSLQVGLHLVELTLYDADGHLITDLVQVNIESAQTATTTTTSSTYTTITIDTTTTPTTTTTDDGGRQELPLVLTSIGFVSILWFCLLLLMRRRYSGGLGN